MYHGQRFEPCLRARALYDYEATNSNEMGLREGDVVAVLGKSDSGWWDCLCENGQRGWFPSNYCAVVPGTGENGDDRQASRGTSNEASSAPTNGLPNGTRNGRSSRL